MWVGIISQLFDISLEYEELWIIKGFKGQNQHAGTWRVCSFRYKPNQWQIQIQQRHLDWVKNYIRKKLQHLWVLVYELSNAAVVPRGHQITNHNTSPPPHPPPPPIIFNYFLISSLDVHLSPIIYLIFSFNQADSLFNIYSSEVLS